jgi:hypothetical protein
MDDDFSLDNILEQLEGEVALDLLPEWGYSLYDKAHQCHEAAKLALIADDLPGYEYWYDQSRQYSEAFWKVRDRIRYFKDRAVLEVQWLLEDLAPYFSEDK